MRHSEASGRYRLWAELLTGSADGERFVFESGGELWIAKADGSNLRKIEGVPDTPWTRLGAATRDPALSPDGRWIAFFHPEVLRYGDLWVVPADGGEGLRLTFDVRNAVTPVWTPDSRFIVFSSSRAGSRTLWKIPASGGSPEPVTTGAGEGTGYFRGRAEAFVHQRP